MAWVTTLGPDMAQVEYRLNEQCGCDAEHQQTTDAQVDYRLGSPGDLEWIGGGLADVGLVAGETVDKGAARALMNGRDPRTGERLVKPKLAVDPRAKVGARELVDAVTAAAAKTGAPVTELLGDPRLVKRFERLEKGLRRDGEAHRLPVREAEAIAAAAGVDPAQIYGAAELTEARRWADKRVRIGNRGYDLTLDLPKRFSAVVALLRAVGRSELAAELEQEFLAAARETAAAMEQWAGYAMAGKHGEGRTAERLETSGLLGWMTVHRSARPVDGAPGDPHLHVHISIANMVLASDGKWRTVGAGGRDIHRHAKAADALVKARLRQRTARFGMRWERDPDTGAWDVSGVPDALRREFSRRSAQIAAAACEGMSTHEQKLIARQLAEAKQEDTPTTDVYASWLERAEAVVGDVEAMLARAVPGPEAPGTAPVGQPGPVMPTPQEAADFIWRRDGGLVEDRKAVSRAEVLAATLDACPQGVESWTAGDELTTAVLTVDGHAVPLPRQGAAHLTNADRYTHTSVLDAEQAIIDSASARLGEGAAQITQEAAELAVSTAEIARGVTFSDQQRAVVHRFLTAGHGVEALIGVPGSGKTMLMSAARAGWEAAGLRVRGASTAAVAAALLQAESGITSRTTASWLYDIHSGGRGLADVDVLVVDEAANVDDRDMAELIQHAAEHGTKLIGIGDPQQMRAIGVGGAFAAVHRLVGGMILDENRRQQDAAERTALEVWRDGGRRTALAALAGHGRVHAVNTPQQAHTELVGAWMDASRRWASNPHDLTESLLLLAARNEDVDLLNGAVRALLKRAGELNDRRQFTLAAGGEMLELAVGDLVRVRANDYRSRRGEGVDVLNGYRGVVTEVDDWGVRVEWRRPGPDGPCIEGARISLGQIAAGALSHGYAMTIAAAQGSTSDLALVYGTGADAYSLYPALSRAREETHLWLPNDVIEDDETRRRLGEARSPQELLNRAVAAYAQRLERDQPDRMIAEELDIAPDTGLAPPGRGGPLVPPWREREFGHLPGGQLHQHLTQARDAAASADRTAHQHTEQARRLAEVLGTDRAPGRRHAAELAARLEECTRHLDHMARLGQQMAELSADNDRDRLVEQRVTARAERKRSALTGQRAGLQRDAALLRQMVAERAERIERMRRESDGLAVQVRQTVHDAQQAMETRITASTDPSGMLHAVGQLRAALPAYAARMDVADRARHEDLLYAAAQQQRSAAQQRARAARLHQEAELRRQMPPELTIREGRERSEAARQAQRRRDAVQARRGDGIRQPHPSTPAPTQQPGPGNRR